MKNILTFKVESALGVVFISMLSVFFVSILFIEIKNFNSDSDVFDSTSPSIKFVSPAERAQIQQWVIDNHIHLLAGQGFRYLIKTYPDKPWLE